MCLSESMSVKMSHEYIRKFVSRQKHKQTPIAAVKACKKKQTLHIYLDYGLLLYRDKK